MKLFKQLFLIVLITACVAGTGRADRKRDDISLVMVPRNESAVRVGMDLASRYPTLLVSYKALLNGGVSLHGWTGKEWVNITESDYLAGNFFRRGPEAAVLIESDNSSLPTAYIPPAKWCESVYTVKTVKTRPLLHLLGLYYDFEYKDWKWFSQNYKQSMNAINPNALNITWYHKSLAENLAASDTSSRNDLQYWDVIREPLPAVEPVEEEPAIDIVQTNAPMDEAESDDDDEATKAEIIEAVEELEVPEPNPLNEEISDAVILGAGEADTKVADEAIKATPKQEVDAEAQDQADAEPSEME